MGIVPVPERVIVCGLLAALSEMVIAPVCSPAVVGVNVTLIVQLPPAATVMPQLLVCANCPLDTILVMLSDAVPVFLSVTDFATLVVFTRWLPKDRLVADKLTTGAVPVPERVTLWGLPAASSTTVIAPVRVPVAVGVNVTLIAQFAPAGTEMPQLFV
jgi:hypothetical protein